MRVSSMDKNNKKESEMNKKEWKINRELSDKFQTCIERGWEFNDKAPLTERKWVNRDMLPFYIRNYK